MATIPNNSAESTAMFVHGRPAVPPLQSGDCLSRIEFERRWELCPSIHSAELINGVVYVNAAYSVDHSGPHAQICHWLSTFSYSTPHTAVYLEPSVRLDDVSMPQPDVALCLDQQQGGRSHVSKDRYLEGPPELIVEVANSSVSYDLHQKLDVYRRHGVQEYIVWRVYDGVIDWLRLVDGQYVSLAPGDDGILRSSLFHGLWLDPAALLRGDQARVLTVLNAGLASDEHRTQTAAWGGAVS
jgi:Uma2 family endonuclease